MSRATAPRITVVGSANIDHVARCERLPRRGETVTDAVFERIAGGKGANQALAAAQLGATVRFVGRVGRDDFPLWSLRAEGVDVSCVGRDDGESGVALILVAQSGENAIVVAPGANRRLTADEVAAAMADAVPDAVIWPTGDPFGDDRRRGGGRAPGRPGRRVPAPLLPECCARERFCGSWAEARLGDR